jgi:hypothetical protein
MGISPHSRSDLVLNVVLGVDVDVHVHVYVHECAWVHVRDCGSIAPTPSNRGGRVWENEGHLIQ